MNANVGDFAIPNTPPNAAMAASVQQRILADAAKLRARNAFWRLSGLGIFAVLAGAGVGCALYGYSYVTDQRAAGDQIAQALVAALRNVKVDGTVKLDPGATVKLDPGATVHLDNAGIGRPTEQQLLPNALPPSDVKPVTNFTIFKTVKFENGAVITGWNYNSSTDDRPDFQYCYYSYMTGEHVSARFTIANDGVPVTPGSDWTFNSATAFSNCVWFGPIGIGRKT